MITARRVKYVSVQDNLPASVVTAAETWGQLKEEVPTIGLKASGMKVHIKETNTEVTSDSQYLPVGDFSLYFLIEKNKSGNNQEVEEAVEEYMVKEIDPILADVHTLVNGVAF